MQLLVTWEHSHLSCTLSLALLEQLSSLDTGKGLRRK